MNRTQLALSHLSEEWDVVVVLCSRHNPLTGETEMMRVKGGNAFAIQQMLEDETDEVVMGGLFYGGRDGNEEDGEEA